MTIAWSVSNVNTNQTKKGMFFNVLPCYVAYIALISFIAENGPQSLM